MEEKTSVKTKKDSPPCTLFFFIPIYALIEEESLVLPPEIQDPTRNHTTKLCLVNDNIFYLTVGILFFKPKPNMIRNLPNAINFYEVNSYGSLP